MILYLQNKVNIFLNKLGVKTKCIQVLLLDGAYSPTDFKCEITLFFRHKKRPGNGFSVTRSGDLL